MQTIRVVVADDHTLVRAGIRSLLNEIEGVEVVGEAEDGLAALRLAEMHHPDIMLLDIGMPGMSGLEVVPKLAAIDSSIRAVILSMHKGEEYVLEALRAGAVGYLLKDAAVSDLEIALRAVARGETYLSPAVSHTVADDGFAALTPRQREILRMVASGDTSKEIAQQLGLSHRTVEVHRLNLMRRINVHDTAGLVRYAIRAGLVREK